MTNPSSTAEAPKGWHLSATVQAVEAEGRHAGYEYGRSTSRAATLARLLRRQAQQKFGTKDQAGIDLVEALARGWALDALLELGDRLLTAANWSEWLAAVRPPPPCPGIPDYARNLEIDIEPSQPSIDSLAKVQWLDGSDGLVLLRMQKWYQPDLDQLQFEEAMRLEGLHGVRPTIALIMMWPSADGPGITGSHRGLDLSGKPTSFGYVIRRAWQMKPEETLDSLGTLMLAPLTKGAKARMPEIVQKIAHQLDVKRADKKTREAVWITAYWCMGMVCTVAEAHAALGKRLAYVQGTSDYRTAKGNTFVEGQEDANKREPLAAAQDLILRQGQRRFGANLEAEAALAAIDRLDLLDALALRLLTTADWRSLLASP